MPFKSRARRSRRRRRSRPMRRRHGLGSTRSIAVRALKATDQERKFIDVVFDDVAVNDTTTAASIFPLNGIGEGVSNEERIGRKILMRSVYLQLSVEKSAADVTLTGYVRVMVLLDRQANSALPTFANILDLPGTGNPVVELMSPNNLNTSKRFVTLYETRMPFYKGFVEGRILQKFLPLNFTTQYNNPGGTIAQIISNSLLLCLTGHITSGGNVPIFSGNVRLRYVG